MMWVDIASIIFACVTMNHLGLVKAIEERLGKELPIINCVKCATFYPTLLYSLFVLRNPFTSLAISFLASYMALWLELFEGFIDSLYMKLYEKIYSDTSDDTPSAIRGESDTDSSVS